MFYQTLGTTRVAVLYDRATEATKSPGPKPSILLEIFGQGFSAGTGHSLLLSGHVLEEEASGKDLTNRELNEYQVVNSGLIEARVDRDMFFPHYAVDYFIHTSNSTAETTVATDDDGPPELGVCTLTKSTEDKTTTLKVSLTGKYFNASYPPVSANTKSFAIVSSAFASPKEWDVVGTLSGSMDSAVLTVKGASAQAAVQKPLNSCTNVTPAKAPAPKKETKASGGGGQLHHSKQIRKKPDSKKILVKGKRVIIEGRICFMPLRNFEVGRRMIGASNDEKYRSVLRWNRESVRGESHERRKALFHA